MEHADLHSSPVQAAPRNPRLGVGRPSVRRGKGTTLPSSGLMTTSSSSSRGRAVVTSPSPEPPQKRRSVASSGTKKTTRRTVPTSSSVSSIDSDVDDGRERGRAVVQGRAGPNASAGPSRPRKRPAHGADLPHTPKRPYSHDMLAPSEAKQKEWNLVSSSPDQIDSLTPRRTGPPTPVLGAHRGNHASTNGSRGGVAGRGAGKRKMRAMEATYLNRGGDKDATPKARRLPASPTPSPPRTTSAQVPGQTKRALKRRDSSGNSFFASIAAGREAERKAEEERKLAEEARKFAQDDAEWRDRDEEQFRAIKRARDAQNSKTDSATAFFASVPREAEAARRRRSLEKRSAVGGGHAVPQEPSLGEDELYCARFKDASNPCHHCGEPMPKNPSRDLAKLQRRHASVESLSFHQTVSFCHMHRAETRTIPLGLRDGYPGTLDFEAVDRRLETGFIDARLRRVVAKPHLSKFFRRARGEINAMGVAAWKDVSHQGTDSVLTYASPGYYGDLGRAVIIRHVQLLLQWGYLRFTDAIAPLPEPDFIVTVLVPEAATLLIMGDRGWSSDVCKGEEWEAARKDAMDCRKRSGAFGHWRFPDDGEEGRSVMRRLEKSAGAKHRRLDQLRAAAEVELKRKIDAEKEAITRAAKGHAASDGAVVVISSSDTEAPDASEWSGDEMWNDDVAVNMAAQYDELAAAMKAHYDEDNDSTPKAKRR